MTDKDNTTSPEDIKYHYDKTAEDIQNHGHSIKGTVDGEGALKRPFAYTLGASFTIGCEFVSFFPVKGEGLTIVSKVFNKLIDLIKKNKVELKHQIINDKNIYYLPIAVFILDDDSKQMVKSTWVRQLERDSFLSEFSKEDHKLAVIIFTDKHGIFPWDPACESYWPQICPAPLVASAEIELTGSDSFMRRLEQGYGVTWNESTQKHDKTDN